MERRQWIGLNEIYPFNINVCFVPGFISNLSEPIQATWGVSSYTNRLNEDSVRAADADVAG